MASQSLQQLIRQLRRIAAPNGGGLTDADLLRRFADDHDEAAFETLVWRHGPLIFGVCRRLLGHTQDAEDAFQATFLVLARKAGSVRRRTALGPWLYRVAQRVAQRARSRVRTTGQLSEKLAFAKTPESAESVELRRIVTEEVMRLPKRYRSAVVLRYLEGRSTAEAAVALGCPAGTVLSRLAWARRRLRSRLLARGATLSAALAAATLEEAAGAVPARWVMAAVAAAGTFAAGSRSGRPAILAAEVLRAMWMTRMRVGAVVVFGALAAGAGLLMPGTSPGRAEPQIKSNLPPVEVTVIRPTRETTGEFKYFAGQVEAANSVEIRSRITSQIEKVAFRPGAKVKRGDLLFQLNSRACEIEYDRARADLVKAEAQLTRIKLAPVDFKGPPMSVEEAKANITVAQAGVERARFDLDSAHITAPIDGQAGANVLSVGNLASPTTTLATIVAMDPIYVDFHVPEREFAGLQKLIQGRDLNCDIRLNGDNGYERRGKIEFVDNRVESTNTRNPSIRVRASLANPKGDILAGMGATVRLRIGEPQEQLSLPETALRQTNAGQHFVLVVGPRDLVEWRAVTLLGPAHPGQNVVSAGIGPEDRVIIDRRLPDAGTPMSIRETDAEPPAKPRVGGRGARP